MVAGCLNPDSQKMAHSVGFSEESFNKRIIYRGEEKVKQ